MREFPPRYPMTKSLTILLLALASVPTIQASLNVEYSYTYGFDFMIPEGAESDLNHTSTESPPGGNPVEITEELYGWSQTGADFNSLMVNQAVSHNLNDQSPSSFSSNLDLYRHVTVSGDTSVVSTYAERYDITSSGDFSLNYFNGWDTPDNSFIGFEIWDVTHDALLFEQFGSGFITQQFEGFQVTSNQAYFEGHSFLGGYFFELLDIDELEIALIVEYDLSYLDEGSGNVIDLDSTVGVTAVPEPSSFALLAGLTCLIGLWLKRNLK
ncbi:hypothetical protein [Cerasicoccus fimbriatus]|uniref:hypothetical protein n=1 Tax=Cerasicoccus fimbriatus TaxID=3014554 RepID=UPI0022B47970|nr:hypothetical protein [Cerasicoccus sp. TK19100]